MKKLISILFFLQAFTSLNLRAQEVFTATGINDPERVGGKFVFLKDATGKLGITEINSSDDFKNAESDVPNFNVTSAAIWGKLKITCLQNADWYLSLDPGVYSKVSFFQKNSDSDWKQFDIGNALPKDLRQIKTNHLFCKLNLKPGDTTLIVFRLRDYYPIQCDLKVGTLESFLSSNHDTDLYFGFCSGLMIMMLIYNFYLFVINKSVIYLYYLLYILFSLIFTLNLSGFSLHFPSFLNKLIAFAPILPPALFGIFGLLFTLKLFKEALSDKLKKVIYVFMSVAGLNIILSATTYVHFALFFIQILGLLLSILCISSGIIAVRKKQSGAKYYLLGFGAYMCFLFYLILATQGVFNFNSFTQYALITGSALESILLSFALGDKLKLFQKEKEKAQEATLIQAKENERLIKEQNIFLEEKVKERTAELEEKNKEVLDSIHYARRIQQALLAHEEFLSQNLPANFVLFKPKDIVSGDFYWATSVRYSGFAAQGSVGVNFEQRTPDSELFYLAVCDSTGHGVPGAFMSLLNISFLNEAITEKNILNPNEVFNHTRTRLIENISQDGGKDGMDGILVCFESISSLESTGKLKLSYAASNNAPLLVRNKEALHLQADKMPVGKGEKTDSFSAFEIEVQKGDCLYLFTDGFADQFGGPKGKKFKYKQLQEKLISISEESLQKQEEILRKTFEDWQGNLEQVDDVLIIGIKF
jgi:serine phosphatase RsbU (regulator of sigma subunit)